MQELVVWKYPLRLTELQSISMPQSSRLLHVAVQHGELELWALVDPSMLPPEPRRIRIAGTGHAFKPAEDERLEPIGTVLDGDFVWHFFDATPVPF